jgi:hypothetical protein
MSVKVLEASTNNLLCVAFGAAKVRARLLGSLFGSLKSLSPDELLKLASSVGIKLQVETLKMDHEPAAAELAAIAKAACVPGAEFKRIVAEYEGRPVRAFVVIGAK